MFVTLEKMHQKGYISYVKYCLYQVFFIVFNYKMTTRQLNIENRTYYFYNDLVNVINFEARNLKLDKKKPGKVLTITTLVMLIKSQIGV